MNEWIKCSYELANEEQKKKKEFENKFAKKKQGNKGFSSCLHKFV